MSKDDKSLIIYNQPHKGLSVSSKRHSLKIGLSPDKEDKKEYYLNRIKELEKANQKLKDAINSLSGKRDEIKYLKEFRKMFSFYCIVGGYNLTILQCTENIKRDRCKERAYSICKPRKEFLEKIIFNP